MIFFAGSNGKRIITRANISDRVNDNSEFDKKRFITYINEKNKLLLLCFTWKVYIVSHFFLKMNAEKTVDYIFSGLKKNIFNPILQK